MVELAIVTGCMLLTLLIGEFVEWAYRRGWIGDRWWME